MVVSVVVTNESRAEWVKRMRSEHFQKFLTSFLTIDIYRNHSSRREKIHGCIVRHFEKEMNLHKKESKRAPKKEVGTVQTGEPLRSESKEDRCSEQQSCDLEGAGDANRDSNSQHMQYYQLREIRKEIF